MWLGGRKSEVDEMEKGLPSFWDLPPTRKFRGFLPRNRGCHILSDVDVCSSIS